MSRHGQRGQVLPVWAMGIVAMLIVTMAVIRYSDMVRWQVRAQNAADAAAQAIVALQTQQFNEMSMVLYASAVEEFRIRNILYAMELTAYGNGGCKIDNSCVTRYAALETQYLKAVARYNNEVIMLDRVTANMDFTTMNSDAHALLTDLNSKTQCNQQGGGDCAFGYSLVSYAGRTPVYGVQMDARAFIKPSLGGNMTPSGTLNPSLDPVQVEVAVCADVPSPVPAFLNFQPAPHRVIARAAAPAVMMEQDWFQPGSLTNPWSQTYYQPQELPSGSAATDGTSDDKDWYAVNFAGNGSAANTTANGYTFGVYNDDFTAYVGWWNAVPIRPQGGTLPDNQLGCSS
jgi:hypothetical protein